MGDRDSLVIHKPTNPKQNEKQVVETCGGARTMLRDKAMVQELGALVVAKVHAELRRPFDPEAEEMDRVARGLPPSY